MTVAAALGVNCMMLVVCGDFEVDTRNVAPETDFFRFELQVKSGCLICNIYKMIFLYIDRLNR